MNRGVHTGRCTGRSAHRVVTLDAYTGCLHRALHWAECTPPDADTGHLKPDAYTGRLLQALHRAECTPPDAFTGRLHRALHRAGCTPGGHTGRLHWAHIQHTHTHTRTHTHAHTHTHTQTHTPSVPLKINCYSSLQFH